MAVQTFSDRSLDSAVFAAESVLPEENSFTILSSELMLKGEYMRDGDDLIIRGDMGEEIRVEEYFSGDNPPTLETPYGAIVLPETVQKLLVNSDSIEVAGPAGSLSIPGLLGDPIGTIDELGGDGKATAKGADGVVRTLNEGDPIYQDDVIETIGRSFANLRMMDDTSFQLGKETRAIIENYNYTPGVESGSFEATVISGFFRYASGKLGGLDKGTHTTIKTPTAQIGVRGSEMEGVIEEDGSSTFVHKDGILDVSDANGRGTVTLDEPGMATAVSSKPGAPAAAFEAPESLLKSFEEALPPPPDFVVTHDEEGAEGEGELLDAMAALGEGEVEGEEGALDADGEFVAPVVEVIDAEDDLFEVENVQQNAVPTAFNDLLAGTEDGIVTGSLAANDQLGDGQHTWFVAGRPEHGTIEISPNGSFVYTPDANYNGMDSFTYTVRDADGDESTAQVIIQLSEVNDAPVMVVDGVLVFREGDVTIQGAVGVSDVDNTGDVVRGATIVINNALSTDRLDFEPPAGSGITAQYAYVDGVGTLTLSGNGTYAEYQSAIESIMFKSEGGEDPTQNGLTPTRSITWTVTEDDGSVDGVVSEPLTISNVNITPVNNPPTVNGDLSATPISYSSDPNGSAPLFGNLTVDPIENWQTIQKLVFSVKGSKSGDTNEVLLFGDPAEEIPLVFSQGAVKTLSDGSVVTVEVRESDGALIVTLDQGNWDLTSSANFLQTIRYKNSGEQPLEGNREITLESIMDNGGTTYSGVDTLSPQGATAVVSVLVPPSLNIVSGGIPAKADVSEKGGVTVELFPSSEVGFDVSGIDSGKQNLNQLVIRITDAVPGDQLVIGNTAIDAYQAVAAAQEGSGTPAFQYAVSVKAGGEKERTVDVTLTGNWSEADLTTLIGALKYQNLGNDPAAWGKTTRTISLHSLQDDGATPTVSGDDAKGGLNSGLKRVISIDPENQLPSSQGGGANPIEFKGSTPLSLFSGITVSPVEHSQTITQITLSITALSGNAGEKLTINGVEVNLVPTAQTTVNGLTYAVSESVVSSEAPKGKTTITLIGNWGGDAASTLINGITYSNTADQTLTDSRIIRLEGMLDSEGGSAPFGNFLAEVKSPHNQPPELKVVEGNPATNVVFVEDAAGGGTAVQVFSGLTFESSAGLNEDPAQKLRLIEFKVTGIAADDYLIIGGKEILLSSANKTSVTDQSSGPPFDYTIVNTYDGNGKINGRKVTLEGGWTRDSAKSVDDVNQLLQGIYFKNSGNDPAPVGGSAARTFTLTRIGDAGGDDPTTSEIVELGKDAALNIVRQVVIDPYNQSPSLVVEKIVGTPAAPAVYTVSGVEMKLFAITTPAGTSAVDAGVVEASQSVTSLKFTVDGIGGILTGRDGSKEWITVDGKKILLSSTTGDVPINWSGGNSTVVESYNVIESDADSRVVTLNGSWSPAELDVLIQGMSFGLAYSENGQIQGSGVRTVTLTEIKDDGGVESGASNDTKPLNIAAAVEVKVNADGGVSIVNKNFEVVNSNLSSLTTAEQYFQYSEANGNAALLGGADSFEINIRLNGAGTDQLLPGIAFDLFEYKTAAGWVKLRIKSDGNLDLVFEKGSTEATTSVTDTPLLSSTELSDILLDGKAHDLKLTWEYGSNAAPGDFKFYLDNATTPTVTVSDTQLTSGSDKFLESGGTVTIGAPSFSGTIYDISVKSTAGSETREAHWNMDQIDSTTSTIKNVLSVNQYALSITNTTVTDSDQTNNDSVLVDTFLVTEDIDIPELKYLIDQHSFGQVTSLQLNLTGNGAETQVLNGKDLLDLKAGGSTTPEIDTVRVFGDAEDTLTLDAGWVKQTTESGKPSHYIFTSGSDQINLYVESVTVTQLTS